MTKWELIQGPAKYCDVLFIICWNHDVCAADSSTSNVTKTRLNSFDQAKDVSCTELEWTSSPSMKPSLPHVRSVRCIAQTQLKRDTWSPTHLIQHSLPYRCPLDIHDQVSRNFGIFYWLLIARYCAWHPNESHMATSHGLSPAITVPCMSPKFCF